VWVAVAAVVAGLAPLLVLWFDRSQTIAWVGFNDLEVVFVVTDARTGAPVPGARVEVHSEGGLYEERDPQDFVLTADGAGEARKVCRNSMCFGTQSWLRRTDTYAVHLPDWYFRVSAPGYQAAESVYLDTIGFRRLARRAGPGKAQLVVRVPLERTP
jgi:hypothetical protein